MFTALASLLILFVLIRLAISAWRYFTAWLSRGKLLRWATDEIEEQYALGIRTYISNMEAWRAEADHFWQRSKRPRLTRDQRDAIHDAISQARSRYLDLLKLSWYQIVIIFLIASVIGLVIEQIWMLITAGLLESRPGLVWGPFSPLYGLGAVLLTVICWELRKHHVGDMTIFLVSAVVGGLLEQFADWTMETLFDAQSWTYIYLPDHITQWVAWRFLFFWGLIGLVWARYVMPELLYRIGMPTTNRQVIFVGLLTIYLVVDIFMTFACFTRKTARDEGIPPSTPFEEWVDENFTDSFIAGRFQNLAVGEEQQEARGYNGKN